jgi:excisionase family DNA binding protein
VRLLGPDVLWLLLGVLDVGGICEVLNIWSAEAYALLRSGRLPAIQVGEQWRVETLMLEEYISRGKTTD